MIKDKRIDAYILKSKEFAFPILNHIRDLVHKYCPVAEETMKWSFPHFMYNGSILCSMAAFNQHCAFGFWKGSLIPELSEAYNKKGETAMGQFGKIKSIKDLPSDKHFGVYFKKAMKLQDEGIKLPQRQKKETSKTLEVPDYFLKILRKNKKAFQTFNSFSFSNKKEYVMWITEAKTEATRIKRMNTAVEWMEDGKDRNWKYKM